MTILRSHIERSCACRTWRTIRCTTRSSARSVKRFYASWTTTRSRWTRETPCNPATRTTSFASGERSRFPASSSTANPSTNQTTSSPTCARRTLSAAFIAPAPSTVRTRCGRFFSCRGLLQLVPPPIHREHTRRRDAEQAVTMRNQVGRDAGRQRKGRAHWVHGLQIRGAGDGNRTRVMSLEGSGSTIEPHPRFARRLLYRKFARCERNYPRRTTRCP